MCNLVRMKKDFERKSVCWRWDSIPRPFNQSLHVLADLQHIVFYFSWDSFTFSWASLSHHDRGCKWRSRRKPNPATGCARTGPTTWRSPGQRLSSHHRDSVVPMTGKQGDCPPSDYWLNVGSSLFETNIANAHKVLLSRSQPFLTKIVLFASNTLH